MKNDSRYSDRYSLLSYYSIYTRKERQVEYYCLFFVKLNYIEVQNNN